MMASFYSVQWHFHTLLLNFLMRGISENNNTAAVKSAPSSEIKKMLNQKTTLCLQEPRKGFTGYHVRTVLKGLGEQIWRP